MIIKIRTADDGWEFFSCPKGVKTRLLSNEQWKSVWNYEKDTSYIIADIKGDYTQAQILSKKMTLINIYDNIKIFKEEKYIAYLLNDEGKTIERIN